MTPPGLVAVELGKQCVLVLTEQEYLRALRRGKWWRRREAEARRAEKAAGPSGGETPPPGGRP